MTPNASDCEPGTERGRRARDAGASDRPAAAGVSGGRGRGQTTLDFAVGVSLFVLVLLSVFLFVPGTIEPFTEGGQEDIITANRVADSLSEGLLGDPSSPHVLNTTCTVRLFENGPDTGCRYEGNNLTERIGVKNRQFVNVSLESNGTEDADGDDLLCWNTGSGEKGLIERDHPDCDSTDERMAIGGSPPSSSSTSVTARRVVEVNETDATLLVEMW